MYTQRRFYHSPSDSNRSTVPELPVNTAHGGVWAPGTRVVREHRVGCKVARRTSSTSDRLRDAHGELRQVVSGGSKPVPANRFQPNLQRWTVRPARRKAEGD